MLLRWRLRGGALLPLLEESERRLALEALLHRLEREHAVDREMAAVLAQKVEVLQRGQPFVVVYHQRVRRALAKCEELSEHLGDTVNVLLDFLLSQHLARGILAARVAHLGGAAADQHNRLVAAALEVTK